MENSFVESLLGHHTVPLSSLLNSRFNEHIELTYVSQTYFIHFLMGISAMLMSNDIRSKYGVRRVFFTNFNAQKVARLVILTEKELPGGETKTEKSMKVRTFDMNDKRAGYNAILSADERKVMKFLLSGEKGDLSEEFVAKIEAAYKNYQTLEKINLDEYAINADYAVYGVRRESLHKLHQLDTQTRVRLNFYEIFEGSTLRKQAIKHYINDPSRLSIPSEPNRFDFAGVENKIILFTDKKIITRDAIKNFRPNAVSDLYREYYNAQGQASLEKFANVLMRPNGLADIHRKASLVQDIASECGFVHGSLFLLSYPYPSFVEVGQKIATALYSPNFEQTNEASYEMSLIHKPKFIGTDQSLHQIPIVVLFPRHHSIIDQAASLVPSAMTITGEVGAISVRLKFNEVLNTRMLNLEKRSDIADLLFKWVEKESIELELLPGLVEYELTKVRSPSRKYKFTERNYFSRYLAGWLASSNNQAFISQKLATETGGTGGTRFLIKSAKESERESEEKEPESSEDDDSDMEASGDDEEYRKVEKSSKPKKLPPPTYIMLVVKEEALSKMHFPDTYHFEEDYIKFARQQGDDTLVLNIGQEYVHSTSDILQSDVKEDFTRFAVSVSFAKSEDVLNAHAFSMLPNMPLSTLDDSSESAIQLKLAEFLQLGAYFAADHNEYEAFLDGIFLNNECLKGVADEKSPHIDTYYIRKSGKEMKTMKINLKNVPHDLNKQKLIRIAKSANEELKSNKLNGQVFQLISTGKNDEFNVKLVDEKWLSLCANLRLRRSRALKTCHIDFKDLGSSEQIQDMTSKAHEYLGKILKISHHMMLGLMVRDTVADALNGNYWALGTDVGFLLASTFSPALGEMVANAGSRLITTGSEFSGSILKGLGFGIKRAISAYVLTDLIKNAVAYARDTNDTAAMIGMAIDGAFMAADALTLAAEVLGAGAVLGPLAEVAGVLFIVGYNVYETAKRVQQIESLIPLNTAELIDESLRAFFHIKVDSYIQKLIDEKKMNDRLMKQATDYLNSQNAIDTYVTASAIFSGKTLSIHGNTMIDMRTSRYQRVSKTSPGIRVSENLRHMRMACFVHEQQIETEHKSGLWNMVSEFFLLMSRLNFIAHYYNQRSECSDCLKRNTPTCHNAFGVSKARGNNKAALFKLGSASDHVFGYSNKSNIFLMAGGTKNVAGGDKNDTLIVGTGPITGLLDGQGGTDILDLSSFSPEKLLLQGDVIKYVTGTMNSSLQIRNIETLILPTGVFVKRTVEIAAGCEIRRIVAQDDTNIYLKANHLNELVLEISGKTDVINYAQSGQITYLIRKNENNPAKNTSLSITGNNNNTKHMIFFIENLWDIDNMTHQASTIFLQMSNAQMIQISTSWEYSSNIELIFKDGSTIRFNNSAIYATLSTSLSIPEVRKMYDNVLQRIGIIMVAYSTTDDESITISHSKVEETQSKPISHVLHNAIDHSTHMALNGGRYLIIIHPNDQGKFENITIMSTNVDKLREVVIDLSVLINFYIGDNSSFIGARALLNDQATLDVEIKLNKSDSTIVPLGHIFIQNILSNEFYDKIILRNYGQLKINLRDTNYHDIKNKTGSYEERNNILTPTPVVFGNSTNIFVLTPYNVEPCNEIRIDIKADRFDHYSIDGKALMLTNFRHKYRRDFGNMVTVFIQNFYDVKKMNTLQLYIGDRKIDLREINNSTSRNFSDMEVDIQSNWTD